MRSPASSYPWTASPSQAATARQPALSATPSVSSTKSSPRITAIPSASSFSGTTKRYTGSPTGSSGQSFAGSNKVVAGSSSIRGVAPIDARQPSSIGSVKQPASVTGGRVGHLSSNVGTGITRSGYGFGSYKKPDHGPSYGTTRGGLHISAGSNRPGHSGFGFGFGCNTYGSHKKYYDSPYRYPHCYSPCVYRYRSGFRFGFGFYTAPVAYPVYPSYATVYEPYPVYTTVYEPYPVYTSAPTYIPAEPMAAAEENVFIGTYVDQRQGAAVVENEAAAGYGRIDSQRDAGLVLREQSLRDAGLVDAPSSSAAVVTPPASTTLENGTQVVDVPAADSAAGSGAMPDDEANRFMKEGVEAFAAGEYEQAAQRFLDVAMADPDNVDATLAYATSRFATGDYPTAAIAIRRGVRRAPDVVNALFDLRDRYSQMAHFDRQLMVLTDWLAEHPEDVDALVTLGFVQHFTAQREQAAETFRRLERLSEADADLAKAFLEAKSIEELQRLAAEWQQAMASQPANQ